MKEVLILTETSSFENVVQLLDNNGNGFLPVVDSNKKLYGVITDGDLRRGILNRNLDLHSIINEKPTTMPSGTPHSLVRKKLKEIHRRHMPLIDNKGVLVEVVVLDDFEVLAKKNWVVIMAGGLGSRLGELTNNTPKPMLQIGNKPILEHILDNFKEVGFNKFIFCVNHKAEVIQNYFKDGANHGVEIRYTFENKRMGTAGALSLIDFELEADFFVVNADVITTLNYTDFLNFHNVSGADATMFVNQYSHEVPYACIESDKENNLLTLVEKPKYNLFINAGIYILKKELLKLLPKDGFYDMPDFFELILSKGKKVKVYRRDDYWLDVGSPKDYKKAKSDFLYKKNVKGDNFP